MNCGGFAGLYSDGFVQVFSRVWITYLLIMGEKLLSRVIFHFIFVEIKGKLTFKEGEYIKYTICFAK